MDKKPIAWRQLCALTRDVLLREPTIDDVEWRDRVKDTMVKYGFRLKAEDAHAIPQAMSAVEQSLKQTMGSRPVRNLRRPQREAPRTTPTPAVPVFTSRTNQPPGWDIVVRLMARLKGSAVSAPSSRLSPRETLAISEEDAVNEFWRAAGRDGADRIALLRAFAEITIVRPPSWNADEIRAQVDEHQLFADRCFACGGQREALSWHHVIQVQHGSGNYARNRVAICAVCHGRIHPWLPQRIGSSTGWTCVGEFVKEYSEAQRRETG